MQQIQLSDQLFSEVSRKANAIGLSVERFVAETLQQHLLDDVDEPQSLRLTPEQAALVRNSQAQVKRGGGLSIEQVEERLAAKKAAWLTSKTS